MKRPITSLYQFFEAFPDEQAAVDHLRAIRWKDGAYCPHCKSPRVMHFSDKKTHKCSDCRQRFSIKVGTIFEDTKLPLRKWFAAIWLVTSHKKGIASTQLAKDLEITQKSAWFVLHRLRYASRTQSFNRPLDGTVEIDETYFGGKETNKPKRKRKYLGGSSGKAIVFGVLERGGELRVQHVGNLRGKTIKDFIKSNVSTTAALMTDDASSYTVLDADYVRHAVNHSAGEYVRHYTLHINSIEGAWGLFKPQVYGIHHHVSPKHLGAYLSEMCCRYNRRDLEECERVDNLLSQIDGRLTYKALIHDEAAPEV